MSSLKIHDLAQRRELKQQELSAVRGGKGAPVAQSPFANVNVEVAQNIVQFQDIEVNALNNVGVIGAGFGPLALNVSPKQVANTRAVF